MTSEGSPTLQKKKGKEAQKPEIPVAPVRRLGGEFVLGMILNPIHVRANTKDGGDDDKSHPWELDTSGTGTHGLEGNSKIEVDMVEALPTGALEATPTLAATLDGSKHAPA